MKKNMTTNFSKFINENVEKPVLIQWYDRFIFGKNKTNLSDPFGFNNDFLKALNSDGDIKL